MVILLAASCYMEIGMSSNPIKPLKSEAIHETGLSGYVVASFFPLIIFILLCFNVLSTVPRENRLTDFLYIYIYICIYIIYLLLYRYFKYVVIRYNFICKLVYSYLNNCCD